MSEVNCGTFDKFLQARCRIRESLEITDLMTHIEKVAVLILAAKESHKISGLVDGMILTMRDCLQEIASDPHTPEFCVVKISTAMKHVDGLANDILRKGL